MFNFLPKTMRRFTLFTWWILALICAIPLNALGQSYTYNVGDQVSSDEGVFKIVGENLITNPSFDDGTTGWTAGDANEMQSQYFTVEATGGADDGAYLKALSNNGSGKAQSIRTAWQLTAGKTYFISMWSKNEGQYCNLYLGASATSTNSVITNVPSHDSWTQTTAVFTATSEYTYCVANFAWLSSSACFDCFFLAEVESTGELATETLETAISEAEQLLSETEEGTESGQYTAEVRGELQTAITAARNVLSTATQQSEITDAVTALNTAVTNYTTSKNPPFVVGEKYVLINRASGLYLTNVDGTMRITEDSGELSQAFTFVKAPDGALAIGYNLVDGNGNYVYRSGSWDTKAGSTDLTAANALFNMVENGDYYQIKNMGSGSVLGVDNTSSSSSVYSNKNGTDNTRNDWSFEKYVASEDRDAEYFFEQALTSAKSTLANIDVALCGTNPFDYSQDAYDAFEAAVEHAEAVTGNYETELATLNDAVSAFELNKIVPPDATKTYNLVHSSGLLLNYTEGSTPTIASETGGDEQKFMFVSNDDGTYSIMNVQSSAYVSKNASSSYNMSWASSNTDNESHWTIYTYSAGVKVIQNLAGSGHIGADNTSSGSTLYCDKANSLVNSHWTIEEASLTRSLDNLIATAQNLYDSTPVGTEYYEVSQSAKDALLAAINKANTEKANCTTIEQVNVAVEELNAAITTFNDSFNEMQAFDTSISYNISHYGGNYLAVENSKLVLSTPETEDEETATNQQFDLVPVTYEDAEGNVLSMTYSIKSVSTGLYVSRTGNYNTTLVEENDTTAAIVQIEHISGKYLGIKFLSSSTYLGSDAATTGSSVYSDKDAVNSVNAQWIIKAADAIVTFDKTALKTSLDAANALLETMVWGNEVGQYYQKYINEFTEVISKYNTIYKTSKDVTEVNTAANELNNLIEEYKNKANTEVQDILDVAADVLAEAEAAYTEATANIGNEKGQYLQTTCDVFRKFIDDFKANPTLEVMYTISDETKAFKANTIQIDRSALATAITEAETAYAALQIGDYNGQTPSSAAQTLSEAISAAKVVYEQANKLQQTEVNAAVTTLQAAIKACADAVVTITFDELDSNISELSTYISGTTNVGSEAGQLPQADYDLAKAALDKANGIDRSAIYQSEVDDLAAETASATQTLIAALKASSGLEELIATSTDVYENVDHSQASAVQRARFRKAIENAESVYAEEKPTQSELTSAYNNLKDAYDTYVVIVSINAVDASGIGINTSKGYLGVSGLSEESVTTVFTTGGARVASANGSTVEFYIPSGNYVVNVKSGNVSISRTIQVK